MDNRPPEINQALPAKDRQPKTSHKPVPVRRKLMAGAFAALSALGLVHHVDNNINGPLNTGAAADLVGSATVDLGAQAIGNYVAKPAEDFAGAVGDEVSQIIAGKKADVYANRQSELADKLKVNLNNVDEIFKGEITVKEGVGIRVLPDQSYLDTDIGGNADVMAIDWNDITSINGKPWNQTDSQFTVKDAELVFGQNPGNYSDGSKRSWMRLDFGIKGSPEKTVTGFISISPETSGFVTANGEHVGVESAGTDGYKSRMTEEIFRPFEVGQVTVNPPVIEAAKP